VPRARRQSCTAARPRLFLSIPVGIHWRHGEEERHPFRGKGHRDQTVRRWRAHPQGEHAHQRRGWQRRHLSMLPGVAGIRRCGERIKEGGGRHRASSSSLEAVGLGIVSQSSMPPESERDRGREWGEKEMAFRVSSQPCGGGFVSPEQSARPSDLIQRPALSGGCWHGPWAAMRAVDSACRTGRCAAADRGPSWRIVSREFFSLFIFYIIQFLMDFVQKN
jgi:hypothetical protein